MKYQFYKGEPVNSITDWEREFHAIEERRYKKDKHERTPYNGNRLQSQWKIGRSAETLADFSMHDFNQKFLIEKINKMFSLSGIDETLVEFEKGIIEFESSFDTYWPPRSHDLALFGHCQSGEYVFVSIEAKVDEPFDKTIKDKLYEGERTLYTYPRSNLKNRIDELVNKYLGGYSFKSPNILNLRYQLLQGFAAVDKLDEFDGINIKYKFMIILSFDTSALNKNGKILCDKYIAASNKMDYLDFMNHLSNLKEVESGLYHEYKQETDKHIFTNYFTIRKPYSRN